MKIKLIAIFIILVLLFVLNEAYSENSDFEINLSDEKISQYSKLEIICDGIEKQYKNPFNPEEVSIEGHFIDPRGKEYIVYGFWHQDYVRDRDFGKDKPEVLIPKNEPHWRIRFTPTEIGKYRVYVVLKDSNGIKKSSIKKFIVEPSVNSGFIQTKDAYYVFNSGKPFFGLGENVAWWSNGRQKTYFYEEMFEKLKSYNVSLVRVWMNNEVDDNTYCGNIEDRQHGLNNYDLKDAYRYNKIFELAEKNNIYIRLSLLNIVNFVDENWDKSWLYNAKFGGPCRSRFDFFINEDAKKQFKKFLRYLVARYGHSVHLHSWELWNELYNGIYSVKGWDEKKIVEWCEEMSDYIKSIDNYGHVVSTSSQTGLIKNTSNYWKALDDADAHVGYNEGAGDWREKKGGRDMTWAMPYYLNYIQSLTFPAGKKPVIFGEWALQSSKDGPNPYELNDKEGISYHNAIWSLLMSGGFGGLLRWYWDYKGENYFWTLQNIPAFQKFTESLSFENATYVALRNLIYNSSFEKEESIWSETKGWAFLSDEFTLSSEVSHSGKNSLKWEGKNKAWAFANTKNFVLKPETEYTLSAWVKTSKVTRPLFLVCEYVDNNEPFKKYSHRTNEISRTNEWTKISTSFKTPRSIKDVNLWTPAVSIVDTGGAGEAWIDDVSLTEGNQILAEVTNPGLRLLGLKTNGEFLLWIQDRQHTWYSTTVLDYKPSTFVNETLSIYGMKGNIYEIVWWDTYKGEVIKKLTISPDKNGVLQMVIPDFEKDIAAKIVVSK